MEYYSTIKKKERMPFAAVWMELQIIILSEVSQKDKCHTILLICGIKNMTQIYRPMTQKQTHKHREQACGCQGIGEG